MVQNQCTRMFSVALVNTKFFPNPGISSQDEGCYEKNELLLLAVGTPPQILILGLASVVLDLSKQNRTEYISSKTPEKI